MAQKIKTFLWFDTQAEEAAELYTSLFPDSKITEVRRYGETGPGAPGSAMTVAFELAGQAYVALNGGPVHEFTEAVSLQVDCESQEEVDRLWAALTADGGQGDGCGWLKDKYGLSWQIIPTEFLTMVSDPDPERSNRAMQAMLGMQKLDVAKLREAYEGR